MSFTISYSARLDGDRQDYCLVVRKENGEIGAIKLDDHCGSWELLPREIDRVTHALGLAISNDVRTEIIAKMLTHRRVLSTAMQSQRTVNQG